MTIRLPDCYRAPRLRFLTFRVIDVDKPDRVSVPVGHRVVADVETAPFNPIRECPQNIRGPLVVHRDRRTGNLELHITSQIFRQFSVAYHIFHPLVDP